MRRACYLVEINSSLNDLFEKLDDYGFDYMCEKWWDDPEHIEIFILYYPHEIQILENIFAPYV